MGFKHCFERALAVSTEDVEFHLSGGGPVIWANFLLNPRRLRGSDFLMRWSQGVWSEERLVHAVNATEKYFALPYGPSGVAPDHDVRAFELYFERLEHAGLGNIKRPDLLIFSIEQKPTVLQLVESLGGVQELPFLPESHLGMKELLRLAIVAIECENSLWVAAQMPDYGSTLKPQKRLAGKLGLKKAAVLPTVILKEEDRQPLADWQTAAKVPIHIWHVFYDMAFGIAFDEVQRLINDGLILPHEQVFQAPGGATTKKAIYKVYYQYAYNLALSSGEPKLVAASITDKNGHILPFVKFEGGTLALAKPALSALDGLVKR